MTGWIRNGLMDGWRDGWIRTEWLQGGWKNGCRVDEVIDCFLYYFFRQITSSPFHVFYSCPWHQITIDLSSQLTKARLIWRRGRRANWSSIHPPTSLCYFVLLPPLFERFDDWVFELGNKAPSIFRYLCGCWGTPTPLPHL